MKVKLSANAQMNLARAQKTVQRNAPALVALGVMALLGAANAASAIDTAANTAAAGMCTQLKALTESAFVAIVAVAMFVGGGIMWWLKVRGGFAMMAGGLLGFFLVKQLIPLAKGFGILPSAVTC